MTEQHGTEWSTEGWAGSGAAGDRWKMSEAEGELVRIRMKEIRTLPSPRGEWEAVMSDVDVIDADGKGYSTMSDVALGNAWIIGTFREHLPYSAIGVVEAFDGQKGKGYRLRAATDEELARLTGALDPPGF